MSNAVHADGEGDLVAALIANVTMTTDADDSDYDELDFADWDLSTERGSSRFEFFNSREYREAIGVSWDNNGMPIYHKLVRHLCDVCAWQGNDECQCPKIESWAEANLAPVIVDNFTRAHYAEPTLTQQYAIPAVQSGGDVKCHADAVGSGMSASFLVPITNWIHEHKQTGRVASCAGAPFALILLPTRELCVYLASEATKLTHATGVSVAMAYGGHVISDDFKAIRTNGCDILLATSGRALALIKKKHIFFNNLRFFVLDEADLMLDVVGGFVTDVREIVAYQGFPAKDRRQTLCFSSTYNCHVNREIEELLRADYKEISHKDPAVALLLTQRVFSVRTEEKKDRLLQLLREELAKASRNTPRRCEPKICRTLVFVRSKKNADAVALFLNGKGFPALSLNADLCQEHREAALIALINGRVRILVTTDIMSRGFQIHGLDHVVNFDLPDDHATYIHRKGRTGRSRSGTVTSFYDPENHNDTKLTRGLITEIQNSHNKEVPEFLTAVVFGTNH